MFGASHFWRKANKRHPVFRAVYLQSANSSSPCSWSSLQQQSWWPYLQCYCPVAVAAASSILHTLPVTPSISQLQFQTLFSNTNTNVSLMSLQNLKALVTISLWTGHWNGIHVNRIHTQGNLGTFHTGNEENHDMYTVENVFGFKNYSNQYYCMYWKFFSIVNLAKSIQECRIINLHARQVFFTCFRT